MNFGYVPGGHVSPAVFAMLDRAVTRGLNEWAEVLSQLKDGRAQLWLAVDQDKPVAALVSNIDSATQTLEIWLAGGAVLSGCVPFLEIVIEASKAAGTTNGRIVGRNGWQRVLKPYGWSAHGDELTKDWSHEV